MENFRSKFLNSWSTMIPIFKSKSIIKKAIWGFKADMFKIQGNQKGCIWELQSYCIFVIWLWKLNDTFLTYFSTLYQKLGYNEYGTYELCAKYNQGVEAVT